MWCAAGDDHVVLKPDTSIELVNIAPNPLASPRQTKATSVTSIAKQRQSKAPSGWFRGEPPHKGDQGSPPHANNQTKSPSKDRAAKKSKMRAARTARGGPDGVTGTGLGIGEESPPERSVFV